MLAVFSLMSYYLPRTNCCSVLPPASIVRFPTICYSHGKCPDVISDNPVGHVNTIFVLRTNKTLIGPYTCRLKEVKDDNNYKSKPVKTQSMKTIQQN